MVDLAYCSLIWEMINEWIKSIVSIDWEIENSFIEKK